MSENSYYKVSIQVDTENAKGQVKKRREEYIVQAISPTDVEVKMTEYMKGSVSDWEISSLVQTKIIDIVK